MNILSRSAAALVLAAAVSPGVAVADEWYGKLGFSHDDVGRYFAAGRNIASCSLAQSLNSDPAHPSVALAPRVATLYGQCRAALQKHHVSRRLLKVNETFLGLSCITIGASGGDAHAVPACDLDPV